MTVEDWVLDAVERSGAAGATLREIQRDIDERRFEELAVDTIESALAELKREGRVTADGDRWKRVRRTSKEDALRKLFGE